MRRADTVASPAAGPGAAALALDTYTDVEAMRGLLQRHLPGFADGRLRIEALAVLKVRRNSSLRRNPWPMTVCYDLQVRDERTGRRGQQQIYAKVLRPALWEAHAAALAEADGPVGAEPRAEGAPRRRVDVDCAAFAEAPRQALAPPAFGQARALLPALGIVAWATPNDPVLWQLPALLGARAPAGAEVADIVPWAALGLARETVAQGTPELLRYEPEQRATLRYTLEPAGGGAPRVVYAKTFRDGRAGAICERFRHFERLACTDRSAPCVARPLGHCEATRTFWQEAAAGTPWLPWLLSRPTWVEALATVRAAAAALAVLHAAPQALAGRSLPRSAAHWVGESRRRQTKIDRAAPRLASRVARVADAIGACAERQAGRAASLIHGDFHPDQLWVHADRIVLFDFDEFTLGDPMEDVAEFVTKLEQARAQPAIAASFVAAYAACAPQRFDAASLAWHVAVQSLLQASRAFVYQRPGWEGELERRLAASEARAAALLAAPPP